MERVVSAALRTEPAIDGKLEAGATTADYTFTPNAALRPATAYRISLAGLVDADGVPFRTQNRLLALLAPMHRDIVATPSAARPGAAP